MNMTDPFHQPYLDIVASENGISPETLREDFLAGKVIYLKSRRRDIKPLGIGRSLPTRINVNLGTSQERISIETELEKVALSERLGADTIMDLSTGGDVQAIRREILQRTRLPLGTVPIYEIYLHAQKKYGDFAKMPVSEMIDTIAGHAHDGVDFMTIHAGLTLEAVRKIQTQPRQTGIVSRGGSLLAYWMLAGNRENPLLTHYDEVMRIFREHNVVISLGDGLRPGSLGDATDRAQISELLMLGELKDRANVQGVQVMIEGPGHVPLSEIVMNVALQKKLTGFAPFYVLGPLPLDIAPGYDHITSAIGGAIAAAAGADFLCYVTPAEHLRLPDLEDVKLGIIASKIAAQIGDYEKGLPSAIKRNRAMGVARRCFDWKAQEQLAIDPEIVARYHDTAALHDKETCSMCGELCALKTTEKAMKIKCPIAL